jgi:hypothetical protein
MWYWISAALHAFVLESCVLVVVISFLRTGIPRPIVDALMSS